jgi:hypothetical protein
VGEQPVIFPKSGFEYSSACPLNTPNGRMVPFQTFFSAQFSATYIFRYLFVSVFGWGDKQVSVSFLFYLVLLLGVSVTTENRSN